MKYIKNAILCLVIFYSSIIIITDDFDVSKRKIFLEDTLYLTEQNNLVFFDFDFFNISDLHTYLTYNEITYNSFYKKLENENVFLNLEIENCSDCNFYKKENKYAIIKNKVVIFNLSISEKEEQIKELKNYYKKFNNEFLSKYKYVYQKKENSELTLINAYKREDFNFKLHYFGYKPLSFLEKNYYYFLYLMKFINNENKNHKINHHYMIIKDKENNRFIAFYKKLDQFNLLKYNKQ